MMMKVILLKNAIKILVMSIASSIEFKKSINARISSEILTAPEIRTRNPLPLTTL